MPTGVYVPSTTVVKNGKEYKTQSGFYTSDNKFYPTDSPNFVPRGYQAGQGVSTRNGIAIQTQTSNQQSFSTTNDTGTGYNPATNVNEGVQTSPPSLATPKILPVNSLPTVASNQWRGMGTYSSGTASTIPSNPFQLQNTKITTGQKISDAFYSVVSPLSPLGSSAIISGETGKLMGSDYVNRMNTVKNKFMGDILTNPFALKNMAVESYQVRQDFRAKTNAITDAVANSKYDFSINNNFLSTQSKLMQLGVPPSDFKITTTTDGNITTNSFQTEFIKGRPVSAISAYYTGTGQTGKAVAVRGLTIATQVSSSYLVGKGLADLGILGGVETEGGFIGQQLKTLTQYSTTAGRVLEFGSKPLVQIGLAGITGGVKGYSNYKEAKVTGENPWVVGLSEFAGGVSSYYAFTAGATNNEISPIKQNSFLVKDSSGNIGEVKTVSFGEPFTRKYLTVTTNVAGTNYLGSPPSTAFKGLSIADVKDFEQFYNTAEGISFIKGYVKGNPTGSRFTDVYNTVSGYRDVNVKGVYDVQLSNQKGFGDLTPAQQLEYSRRIQAFADLDNAGSASFRQLTGSSTGFQGGNVRPFNDIDITLGAYGSPYRSGLDVAQGLPTATVNPKGQIFLNGNKVTEFLSPQDALQQPLGFFGKYGARGTITAFGKTTPTVITKAGQSLTELGSAITLPSIDSSTGQFVFGGSIDKPQRVLDFYNTAKFLGASTSQLSSVKSSYSFTGLDFSKNVVSVPSTVSSLSTGSSASSLLSSSISSTAFNVFMPKSASSTSANIQTFIPARSSSTSASSLSWGSPSSISYSSLSSSLSSSSSSSSSRSSSRSSSFSSSISSSISSSFSSSSSSTSSSSSSRSSSFSSFGGGGIIFPFPALPLGSGDWFKGSGIRSSKRKFKYTPSYEAIVFNIRGKMPRGLETGARTRPITRGSGWGSPSFTSFKIPNFKIPKLNIPKFKLSSYNKKKRKKR